MPCLGVEVYHPSARRYTPAALFLSPKMTVVISLLVGLQTITILGEFFDVFCPSSPEVPFPVP